MATFSLNFDGFEEEFSLYGIRSPISKEFKFIYNINQSTDSQFKRINDLDIFNNTKTPQCHSLYHFHSPKTSLDYYIINNQSHTIESKEQGNTLFDEVKASAFLYKKFKFYNYLLKINAKITLEDAFNLSLPKLFFIEHILHIDNLSKKEKRLIEI